MTDARATLFASIRKSLGVTGDEPALKQLEAQFGVAAARVDLPGGEQYNYGTLITPIGDLVSLRDGHGGRGFRRKGRKPPGSVARCRSQS